MMVLYEPSHFCSVGCNFFPPDFVDLGLFIFFDESG